MLHQIKLFSIDNDGICCNPISLFPINLIILSFHSDQCTGYVDTNKSGQILQIIIQIQRIVIFVFAYIFFVIHFLIGFQRIFHIWMSFFQVFFHTADCILHIRIFSKSRNRIQKFFLYFSFNHQTLHSFIIASVFQIKANTFQSMHTF